MTQFTLNMPVDKVEDFFKQMMQTNIRQSIIAARKENAFITERLPIDSHPENPALKHPYFDWDFFTNDLLIN